MIEFNAWGVLESPGVSKIIPLDDTEVTIAWINHALPEASDNARLIATAPTVFMALKTLLAIGMPSPCSDLECETCKRMVNVYELANGIVAMVEKND